MMPVKPASGIMYWFLGLVSAALLGMSGFTGHTLYDHAERIARLEAVAPLILQRLDHIQAQLDQLLAAQSVAHQSANSHADPAASR